MMCDQNDQRRSSKDLRLKPPLRPVLIWDSSPTPLPPPFPPPNILVATNIASTDLGPKCWAQQKICLVLEVIFITWRKWTEYIFLRMDWTFLLLTGTFWGGLGMKGVFGLSNNTVFITWISLFWKEIYISRQLNLFLRTMFVVVGLSFVTTTLNG